MPFEAAKAVAATFCYEIRYVLVPVFGPDFVSMCQKCEDSSAPRLSIPSSIIQRCSEPATANQAQSRESSMAVSPRTVHSFDNLPSLPPKSLGPRSGKIMDAESGYGTDPDRSEKYLSSPDSFKSIEFTPVNTPEFTPINTPKLACLETYRFLQPSPKNVTSTPRDLDHPSRPHSKRTKTNTKRMISDIEESSEAEGSSDHSSMYTPTSPKRKRISPAMTREIGAAYTLMELNMADTTLGETKSSKRRRASA